MSKRPRAWQDTEAFALAHGTHWRIVSTTPADGWWWRSIEPEIGGPDHQLIYADPLIAWAVLQVRDAQGVWQTTSGLNTRGEPVALLQGVVAGDTYTRTIPDEAMPVAHLEPVLCWLERRPTPRCQPLVRAKSWAEQ
jgi:hypothetical protein